MPAVNDIDVRARKRAAAARKIAAPADARRVSAARRAQKPLIPPAARKAGLALGVIVLAGGIGFGG
jgi:hypothetical protein